MLTLVEFKNTLYELMRLTVGGGVLIECSYLFALTSPFFLLLVLYYKTKLVEIFKNNELVRSIMCVICGFNCICYYYGRAYMVELSVYVTKIVLSCYYPIGFVWFVFDRVYKSYSERSNRFIDQISYICLISLVFLPLSLLNISSLVDWINQPNIVFHSVNIISVLLSILSALFKFTHGIGNRIRFGLQGSKLHQM